MNIKELWRRLKLVDWIGIIKALVAVSGRKKSKIDPQYIEIKSRILSDANYLTAVSGLKTVLPLLPIPGAAIASPILSLGEMGFRLWKRFALNAEFDQLQYPISNPNTIHLHFSLDPELRKHYEDLLKPENWNEKNIGKLEKIYNDLMYITSHEILKAKYPDIDSGYLQERAKKNYKSLQKNLETIEQKLIAVSHDAKVDQKIRAGFEALKSLFPVMNDWALFNSNGFNEVVDIIDTIV